MTEDRSRKSALHRFVVRHVVSRATLLLILLADWSWRYREHDRENLEACLADERPIIGAFLHGRIFLLLRFMSRARNGRWLSMCSKSVDGDAMARVEEALGFEVVRGSSGRDGLEAIVEMIRRVRRDSDLGACLAIDGSRGPRGRVQGGIVALARRTGGQILPITASARPALILRKAWDRSLLPLPFARIEVVYGEPIPVPEKLSASESEALCKLIEERMAQLQARADEASGFGDHEPVVARSVTR